MSTFAQELEDAVKMVFDRYHMRLKSPENLARLRTDVAHLSRAAEVRIIAAECKWEPSSLQVVVGNMDAKAWLRIFGAEPMQDDLDRMNCPDAGKPLHSGCGWCFEHHQARWMCQHRRHER